MLCSSCVCRFEIQMKFGEVKQCGLQNGQRFIFVFSGASSLKTRYILTDSHICPERHLEDSPVDRSSTFIFCLTSFLIQCIHQPSDSTSFLFLMYHQITETFSTMASSSPWLLQISLVIRIVKKPNPCWYTSRDWKHIKRVTSLSSVIYLWRVHEIKFTPNYNKTSVLIQALHLHEDGGVRTRTTVQLFISQGSVVSTLLNEAQRVTVIRAFVVHSRPFTDMWDDRGVVRLIMAEIPLLQYLF